MKKLNIQPVISQLTISLQKSKLRAMWEEILPDQQKSIQLVWGNIIRVYCRQQLPKHEPMTLDHADALVKCLLADLKNRGGLGSIWFADLTQAEQHTFTANWVTLLRKWHTQQRQQLRPLTRSGERKRQQREELQGKR